MQISTLNFWKMTAALAVAGALVAGLVAFSMPDTYRSVVVARMGTTGRRISGFTTGFRLDFKYTDAAQAQRTTAELMDRLRKEAQSAERQEPGTGALEILEPANLLRTAISPNRWAIGAAGVAAGLLIGIVVVGIRRLSGLVSRP